MEFNAIKPSYFGFKNNILTLIDNFDYGAIMNKIFRLNVCIIYSTDINIEKLGYFLFNVKVIEMKLGILVISKVECGPSMTS